MNGLMAIPVICLFAAVIMLLSRIRIFIYDLIDDLGAAPHPIKALIRAFILMLAILFACVLGSTAIFLGLVIIKMVLL